MHIVGFFHGYIFNKTKTKVISKYEKQEQAQQKIIRALIDNFVHDLSFIIL